MRILSIIMIQGCFLTFMLEQLLSEEANMNIILNWLAVSGILNTLTVFPARG